MGWRGALRSYGAHVRRVERQQVRDQKERERAYKLASKHAAVAEARYQVTVLEDLVERLTSIHKECGPSWNWIAIEKSNPPDAPTISTEHERAAAEEEQRYRPSFFDKLFRRAEKKQADLALAVRAARQKDLQENQRSQADYDERHSDWKELTDLAKRINAGDGSAFKDAAEELGPFSELTEFGSRIELVFREDRGVEVILSVNGEVVIPSEVKSQLQSGKLSVRKMPESRFNELYQDYVAGAVLRIGRELMALLPVGAVLVTARARMLNTASGHIEDQAILSVIMPRATLQQLNFEGADPSDALRNFVNRMDFKKGKGFSRIDPLTMIPL